MVFDGGGDEGGDFCIYLMWWKRRAGGRAGEGGRTEYNACALLCPTEATPPYPPCFIASLCLRTSAICSSLAAAWMASGGMRPVGPTGSALAAAGVSFPFFLADDWMEAVVAMDPRLALLAVAVRAEPLPPPFCIVRDAGCV